MIYLLQFFNQLVLTVIHTLKVMGVTTSCLTNCCGKDSPARANFRQEPLTDISVQSPGLSKRRAPPSRLNTDNRNRVHKFVEAIQNSPRQMKRFAVLMQKSPRRVVDFILHPRQT